MLLGFSDFIPANSAVDWTTWEDWGSGGGGGGGGGVCVCGGGGVRYEAISKLKYAGATRALPRSHVSCLAWPVLYTVSLKQTPTVSF